MTRDAPSSLFAGGGEVGREMAARDWADTPVGPPEQWPAALRNLVRIVLTSRFSMWAAWGPELSFFYNDAYRRDTLQGKHPWALGRPAAEVWAEVWDAAGPRIESVLATGVATWDEDLLLFLRRSGYPEETYHTFSYSPVDGDDGRTTGMLCVVTENTGRVLGERRMAGLRDLAAAVAATRTEDDLLAAVGEQLGRNPADLPFSATYLLDDDGTARLGAATGLPPDSPVAPPALPADGADTVWPVVRLRAGEEVVVEDLGQRFPGLPTGAWQRPPEQAVAVPITASAPGGAAVAGFLVVGLNPHRRLDDAYRGFLELVANQIASGLLNARSHEAERRRAETLAELDRAKTDFFSNVSHEFRTPLTLITGPVAELRSSPVVAADARLAEELEVVERNALRLQKLVNTLLDFSRLQAGRIEARFEPVDLAAVTAELASVFRSAFDRAGLALTVDCPPLGRPVHIDRDMWEKVVLNLLSNALKFTFTGGVTVRLREAGGEDGGRALLTVSDTGTGIPAGELPRLFERFTRVSGARARSGEGSGIGLAMVRELVGLHGGSIDVASTPDVGTTFTVAVPLGTGHLPPDRIVPTAPEAPGVSAAAAPYVTDALRWLPGPAGDVPETVPESPTGRAGRVLVADDNADMRDYVARLLAPAHRVRAVGDGQAALEAAFADPPDLVVSDVMMPGLGGVQLLAALRADARTSRVPVVLLSARAGEEAAVEGLAAGADDYLVKPFSAQELLARVDAHLQLGRARREAEERFTAMADLAPALIWVADGTGRRVFLNAGWSAFTGRPVEEELGEGWRAGLHPQDRDRYAAAVGTAAGRGEGWEVEFRLRRADGAYHWLLERAVPIGGDGAAARTGGYVGSCTDINARYRETERQMLLAELGAVLDRETEVDGQLAALARLVVDRRLADVCTVRVVGDDGRLRYAGRAGVDDATTRVLDTLEPHGGLGRAVLESGTTVLRPHLTGPGDGGVRLDLSSALVVPLTVRGRVRAVLALGRQDDAPSFHEDDRALAEEVAARAALALDNALLLADERATARRLGLLQRATAELSAATSPVDVARAAAGHVVALTGHGSRVGVFEVDDAGRALRLLSLSGAEPEARQRWAEIPLSAPLAVTTAVTERRPVWVEDAADWPGARGGQATTLAALGLASTVALPLLVAGRVVGVIGVGFPQVRRFGGVERAMLLAVAEQCAQALDRARLFRAQQSIASTLQRDLLPQRLPQLERLALAAEYLPGAVGTSAGGDWYDVVELGSGRVAVAVGDVVGQGPSAAAVMGQLRSALSTALLQGSPPAEALELLDRFAARLPGALASTAACLVLDWEAGTVRWARAGHLPPLLVADGTATLLEDGAGTVLGAPGRPPYTEGSAAVAPGTTLLLYTDGLVERRGEVLDVGLQRVTEATARLASADPARLTRALLAEVLDASALPDDVALIAVRVTPPPVHESLPADPRRLSRVRRTVTAWARAAGLSEDGVDDLQLALGEALANAVEHAYAATGGTGRCEYRLARTADGSIDVCVRDEGVWRPVPADPGHRGRGLALISALASEVEVARTTDARGAEGAGTTVRFRFVPAGPGPADPPVRGPRVPPDPDPAGLAVHRDAGGLRLVVTGEVDLAVTPALRAEALRVLEELPAGAQAVLDLTTVPYLASAGVGLVLELQAAAAARRAVLDVRTAPGSAPARVLTLGHPDRDRP
ncbi:PAS domain S-box-containing protein [Geodermatophilus bullaregiensis]|uniref:SpoIIE family protein phosphatase n=1 Tax=Geodermatophilus bullaregiensis TaxID=1564160 RepID=UPI00195EA212|nr:SpoIIE family protein phosphatase [Geodermatophilus bullaregiensis]MBM7806715.1 PAS domain S-box-containing protein [Geodermatophilus bullaregiensis]